MSIQNDYIQIQIEITFEQTLNSIPELAVNTEREQLWKTARIHQNPLPELKCYERANIVHGQTRFKPGGIKKQLN